MLSKVDLRWIYSLFSLYSKLLVIPVTFKPALLGSLMESEDLSIWRRTGFKITQILMISATLFFSFRTLEHVILGNGGSLDWDFFPIMLSLSFAHLVLNVLATLIFDKRRELNTITYNTILKLYGNKNKL